MNIFEALRQSHELQRELGLRLLNTSGDSEERRTLFAQYKTELAVHATAEERHFYLVLMKDDLGVDLSRHAIAEHHEMDELTETLEETEFSSPSWLPRARKLHEAVEHHLLEEERRFFQQAGKLLSDAEKTRLAKLYLQEYETLKAEA